MVHQKLKFASTSFRDILRNLQSKFVPVWAIWHCPVARDKTPGGLHCKLQPFRKASFCNLNQHLFHKYLVKHTALIITGHCKDSCNPKKNIYPFFKNYIFFKTAGILAALNSFCHLLLLFKTYWAPVENPTPLQWTNFYATYLLYVIWILRI